MKKNEIILTCFIQAYNQLFFLFYNDDMILMFEA